MEAFQPQVTAGNGSGVKTMALLTDMNSPLGTMIGNALEVAESVYCLHGNGPEDLTDLVTRLGTFSNFRRSDIQLFLTMMPAFVSHFLA